MFKNHWSKVRRLLKDLIIYKDIKKLRKVRDICAAFQLNTSESGVLFVFYHRMRRFLLELFGELARITNPRYRIFYKPKPSISRFPILFFKIIPSLNVFLKPSSKLPKRLLPLVKLLFITSN